MFVLSFPDSADFPLQECEELMAKGITGTGQGFDLPGRRLGGFSRQPPPSSLRQTALAAAENRARRGALLPSGPRRIGGDSDIRNALSPIQAAAMAAERRLRDELWCGSKSAEGQEGFQGRVGPSLELTEKSKASTSFAGISAKTSRVNSTSSLEAADDEVKWQCNTCTLLNEVNCSPLQYLHSCITISGRLRKSEVPSFQSWSRDSCLRYISLISCIVTHENHQ